MNHTPYAAISTLPIDITKLAVASPRQVKKFLDVFERLVTPDVRQKLAAVPRAEWEELLSLAVKEPTMMAAADAIARTGSFDPNSATGQAAVETTKDLLSKVAGGIAVVAGVVAAAALLIGTVAGVIAAGCMVVTLFGFPAAAILGASFGLIAAVASLIAALATAVAVVSTIIAFVGLFLDDEGVKSIGFDMAGGKNGTAFMDDISEVRALRCVIVRAGGYIDSIQSIWSMKNKTEKESDVHGGQGGTEYRYELADGEKLVAVRGRAGKYIDQISLITQVGDKAEVVAAGPWGGSGGTEFEIRPQHGSILGFQGRSGGYLDALGVCTESHGGQQQGGTGGTAFFEDLSEAALITAIEVSTGAYVDGFRLSWIDRAGQQKLGRWHGGTGGTSKVQKFDQNEVISGITGKKGGYIDQLTIETTDQRTGTQRHYTFGNGTGGTPFTIAIPDGKRLVAVWGREGGYIDAIGASCL